MQQYFTDKKIEIKMISAMPPILPVSAQRFRENFGIAANSAHTLATVDYLLQATAVSLNASAMVLPQRLYRA